MKRCLHGNYFLAAARAARLLFLIFVTGAASAQPSGVIKAGPGSSESKPWGNLQVEYLALYSSDSLFFDRADRLQPASWIFPSLALSQIKQLLDPLLLTVSQKAELTNRLNWSQIQNGWKISPSRETLLTLDPLSRQKIYEFLEQDSRNLSQRLPFRFTPNTFKERFSVSSLNSNQLSTVRSLCYTNHGFLAFADVELLHHEWDKASFDQLIKSLYSAPSLQLTLKVAPGDDIEPIVNYWGKYQSPSRIRSLLESISKMPGGGEVDVLSLLPPFPKLHLYAFPDTSVDPMEAKMDCFFTAMNFFNPQPDPKYLTEAETRAVIESDYRPLEAAPLFGDLIMLVDPRGVAFHVAVYIAENIVFTKNGASPYRPWCLMRIPEMMTYYAATPPHRIVLLRHK